MRNDSCRRSGRSRLLSVLVGIFWRPILTGRSCAVASHNGANLRASNLSVDRQSRSPTSSLLSSSAFRVDSDRKLTIPGGGLQYPTDISVGHALHVRPCDDRSGQTLRWVHVAGLQRLRDPRQFDSVHANATWRL